jgi:hypothetical protein
MLIFAEVLGLYGMIVALLLNAKGKGPPRVRIFRHSPAPLILNDFPLVLTSLNGQRDCP